ncbi:MAG TPA: type II toxin-antitoxin system RelE/ParE family toxin [Gammaproteobacteria bacterium]|nr:type II toxin-antitoxin system RelE/ParE family toxin [Gammaproteobacteria bacterium]
MKRYHVRLTHEVEHDLIDLFDYIARKDSVDNAYAVLKQLDVLILSLNQQPERGHYPPELDKHGIRNFREVHLKPYRLIYEITGNHVVILACFDGRRDMQLLLERRLLR